jgi:hypothetical protein
MGFWGQTQVRNQPAQGVAGDRASQNPITTFDAGPGGLVAGAAGVIVGNFAWVSPPTDPNGTAQIANSFGVGNTAGFVYNVTQALDTIFLSGAGMVIPQGLPVALATHGDFWVVNSGSTEAIPVGSSATPSKVYANLSTGAVSFGPTGSPTNSAVATGSSVAAETFSVTGSIATDVLTVTAVGSGTVYPGSTISGTGITTGTQISFQLTPLLAGETTGGVGRYQLSISQQGPVASTTVSGTYGLLTIGTLTSSAPFLVGQTISGSGVAAGTSITANVTGSGGSGGTMVVNNNTVVSSTTITSQATVETKWYAASAGITGQLVKITSWVGTQG